MNQGHVGRGAKQGTPRPTAMPSAEIAVVSRTDVGRVREHNEDSLLAWQAPWAGDDRVRAVLAVADGMGGHRAGDEASRLTVQSLERVFCRPERPIHAASAEELRDYLVETVEWINEKVHALGNGDTGNRPGTTLTTVLIHRDSMLVGHVGDSRAYLLRDGRLDRLTDDHSLVGEQVRAGTMTEEQARVSPFRGTLTRSIGGSDKVQVDVASAGVRPGDVLLLCSDGLSEYVQELEIAAALRRPDLDAACEELVALALQRGGEDNVTVVAARLGPPAASIASRPTLPGVLLDLPPRRRLVSWPAVAAAALLLGAATGVVLSRRGAEPETPVVVPVAAPVPDPVAETQPARPAEPALYNVELRAEGTTLIVSGAAQVHGIKSGGRDYTGRVKETPTGATVTLNSDAKGQGFAVGVADSREVVWRSDALTDAQNKDLRPGRYLLSIGNFDVAQLIIGDGGTDGG